MAEMNLFWADVIEPLAAELKPRTLLEIGSFAGGGTQRLLDYCRRSGAHLHVVDPKPAYDVQALRAQWGETLTYHLATSLAALPSIGPVDVALVDGDHNWYTVRNELENLRINAAKANVAFPLVFLHDVCWPYGRRDLYYDPDTVPADQRQDYANAGVLPGQSALIPGGGFNSHCFNAIDEGNPRNGVRTAIEDFVADHAGEDFALEIFPVLFGLAIVYRRSDWLPSGFHERLAQMRLAPTAQALVALAERERVDALVEIQALERRIDILERRVSAAEGVVRDNQAQMGLVSERLNRARNDAKQFQSMAAMKSAEVAIVKADLEAQVSVLRKKLARWETSFVGRVAAGLQQLAVWQAGVARGIRRAIHPASRARQKA